MNLCLMFQKVWIDATGPSLVERLELISQGVMYVQWPDLMYLARDKKHAFMTWPAGISPIYRYESSKTKGPKKG